MAAGKQRTKKKWYSIAATGEFDKAKLGETILTEPQRMIGRRLRANLMTLTNDPRKQSVTLEFRVTHLEGDSGVAELVGYTMSSAHVKRVVRKAIRRIDDSFVVPCKDHTLFTVKPLLIARHRTTQRTATALRAMTRQVIQESFLNMKADDVFINIIGNKLQVELKNALRKIYPVAVCEIRVLEKHPAPQQQHQKL